MLLPICVARNQKDVGKSMRFALGSLVHTIPYPPFRRPPGSITVGFDESSFASLRTLGQGFGLAIDSLRLSAFASLR